jgi:hypothetical protein
MGSLLWASAYVGLGAVYGGVLGEDARSRRRGWRRAGLCLVLALGSVALCRLVLTPRLAPATWEQLFYLRRLLPPLLVAAWCAALMPRETNRLLRAALSDGALVPLPQLVVLLATAAVVISCGDLAFSFADFSALDRWLKEDIVQPNAWATNTLILFSGLALVFAITRKVSTALLLVVPIYAGWELATLEKIRYMHAAVDPLEVIRLPAFLPFLGGFFGTGGVVGLFAGLGLWIAALVALRRVPPSRVPSWRRWLLGGLSLAVLVAFPVAFSAAASFPSLQSGLLRLGAPDRLWKERVRLNGLLLTFMYELPATLISTPPNYSAATVRRILDTYSSPAVLPTGGARPGGVNLIVYLVESLMDPDDLGYRWTSDPIPNLRALRESRGHRYAIAPEEFGASANTEFELLTGMTTAFLPRRSLPYRQYIKRPIPSLPRTLRDMGYSTSAVLADPERIYNRVQVYRHLGIDRVMWLHETPGVERTARWPELVSDNAVVAGVIEASQHHRPFFTFAFTNSTHSPYRFGGFQQSALEAIEPPEGYAGRELKEYINTVHTADQAIGKLIQYFSGRSDSTIIAILGDHLPPLSSDALQHFSQRLAGGSEGDKFLLKRRVPLVVWANFDLPPDVGDLSVDGLASYLLEKMKVPRAGLFAVREAVRRTIPVVGAYSQGADGREWMLDSVPSDQRVLIEDYRLLQYDLLFGKQYVAGDR